MIHWSFIYIVFLVVFGIYVVTMLLYSERSWVHRHFDTIMAVTLASAVAVLVLTEFLK